MTDRDALIEAMARALARDAGHDPDAMIPGATKEAGRVWRQFVSAAVAALTAIEEAGCLLVPRKTLIALAVACETGLVTDKDVIGRLHRLAASPYRRPEDGQ